MIGSIKVNKVSFETFGSTYDLKLCETIWGDEAVSVYKDGYYIGLIDLLLADPKEEPLISIANRIKKDVTLLDEVNV